MTFGIIGYGRFGKLWAAELSKLGSVKVFDKHKKVSAKKNLPAASIGEVCESDLLFLLVPISEIENCCRQIKKLLLPTTIVVDACSVKVHPGRAMKRLLPKKQPIIATHPLFGPDSAKKTGTIAGHKIVVCPIRANKFQQQAIFSLLAKMKLEVFVTTPEDHDRQMANSQGLIHFIGRGIQPLKLQNQPLYTPDYLSLLHINEMVVHDTWQLFLDMHRYNPYIKKIRKQFLDRLLKLEREINGE